MALLESLARNRPVIIFDEIKHVIGNKKGIFVSKRNYESLLKTINEIKNNYQIIQNEIKKISYQPIKSSLRKWEILFQI